MNCKDSSSVLLIGGTGFIGSAILKRLLFDKVGVRAAIRGQGSQVPRGVDLVCVGDLNPDTDWGSALQGIDVVVHTAARVHVMSDTATDPLAEFRYTNVAGTLHLVRQAIWAGVRRFIFISSVKVNGESTRLGKPFTADDPPAPTDPYGISKAEAEQALLSLAKETGMEVVIIRPPLVYGPGVKANFLAMMRFLYKGIPIPLGVIDNKRSLAGLDNLVDLIVTCIDHPAAANQIFLAGDGEDLSTTELLKRLGKYLGKPARLIPVPQKILETSFKLFGRSDWALRLCSSLQVDISKARDLLGWDPPVSVDEELCRTAKFFLETGTR